MPHASSEDDGQAAVRVAVIVLAAGRSTRMGAQNKLLADVGGKPMVCRAVETALASKARPVLVVTGHMATEVAAALQGKSHVPIEQGTRHNVPSPLVGEGQGGGESPTSNVVVPPTPNPSPQGGGGSRGGSDVTLVSNPDYATGLASSLKAGIRAVPEVCAGALILLGDMPGIAAEHVDRLVDAFTEGHHTIVVPVHEGKQGNPVTWPRRYFPELLKLDGDAGAKWLIAAYREEVREVELGTAGIFADVDTPEELARIREG